MYSFSLVSDLKVKLISEQYLVFFIFLVIIVNDTCLSL